MIAQSDSLLPRVVASASADAAPTLAQEETQSSAPALNSRLLPVPCDRLPLRVGALANRAKEKRCNAPAEIFSLTSGAGSRRHQR